MTKKEIHKANNNDCEWLFGLHAVHAILKTSASKVQEIRVQKGRDDQRLKKILNLAEQQEIPVTWVLRSDLDSLASGRHQGVAALCQGADVQDENYLLELLQHLDQPPFLLVLDGVTDPHNLGACMRSADAAGIHAVIVPKDNSVGITPTVQKVACGAAEAVPLVVVTNLSRTLKQLQQQGLWIVGTAGETEQLVYDVDLKGPLALVMGAEEKGLRRLTREYCDLLVKLPMAGTVSSLNVSVATGICLFEAVRQRQQ
ncbi:MAG TPA: 23S rRNA (guanosine(2251)-2'-O)-methyltransferase RlmB [Porticoccus sp.]|nr:23S rRNA (guanosine(2251)-2'-O)-methyltransferase RlmB [Porticoccus sp.]